MAQKDRFRSRIDGTRNRDTWSVTHADTEANRIIVRTEDLLVLRAGRSRWRQRWHRHSTVRAEEDGRADALGKGEGAVTVAVDAVDSASVSRREDVPQPPPADAVFGHHVCPRVRAAEGQIPVARRGLSSAVHSVLPHRGLKHSVEHAAVLEDAVRIVQIARPQHAIDSHHRTHEMELRYPAMWTHAWQAFWPWPRQ